MAVHPHACGENCIMMTVLQCQSRYTPTPVGKTWLMVRGYQNVAVHPHACGENARLDRHKVVDDRYTPTPVGKTSPPKDPHPERAVHPHACGENSKNSSPVISTLGTPPRLWGKLSHAAHSFPQLRYTPTPVGKTKPANIKSCAGTVHPHACGENPSNRHHRKICRGTPPRLWGKLDRSVLFVAPKRYTPTPVGKPDERHYDRASQRYTPTPVGKTPYSGKLRTGKPVHPHACGENSIDRSRA